MRIGFIGDCHGIWQDLKTAIQYLQNREVDRLVQVGDFGWWPRFDSSKFNLPFEHIDHLQLNSPLYWIDGNHEDFYHLKQIADWSVLQPQELRSNLFYIPRTTTLVWGQIRFGFLGGGYSIDRIRRTEGVDWFPEELPSYREYQQFCSIEEQLTILVTHDAPTEIHSALELSKNDPISEGNRTALQAVKEIHQPRFWVHGHYHQFYQQEINNCHFVGLADLRKGPEQGTVIFDTDNKKWIFS